MPEKLEIILFTPQPLAPAAVEAVLRDYRFEIDGITSIRSWQWEDERKLPPSALAAALAEVEAGRILLLDLRRRGSDADGLFGLHIEPCRGEFVYNFYFDIDLCPLPADIPRTEAAWISHCLPHIHDVLARYVPAYRAVALGAEMDESCRNAARWILPT